MEIAYLLGAFSAFWLGVLTAISPCPMATNIAAISFISKGMDKPRKVFLSGFFYALGRMATYLLLCAVVVAGLLSMPAVSNFLLTYMNKLLGPLLVIIGMFLLGMISFSTSGPGVGEKMQRLAGQGIWGAALLGFLFAFSLCPPSAALFFGSLVPLSLKFKSPLLFPAMYGFGTAIPVLLFALLIAVSARSVGTYFNKLTAIELWVRQITGILFILAGIYYTLSYIYGVQLK